MRVTAVACDDWRHADASETSALMEAEGRLWRRDLGWDVRKSWSVIEPARAAGSLPGFIARDGDGRAIGWTWFLQHRGTLQVAALVADEREVVEGLVDAVLASKQARTSTAQVWSVRGTPPFLAETLRARGLRVEPYLYLKADLSAVAPPDSAAAIAHSIREWRAPDEIPMAGLLADAYRSDDHIRAFAPDGSDESWRAYLKSLIETDGCGTLLQSATLVCESDGLTGAVVTTTIDHERGVAHLAQIAVHPRAQGHGLARALLRRSMVECHRAGMSSMTLLVADSNAAARRQYEAEGFKQTTTFTVASDK